MVGFLPILDVPYMNPIDRTAIEQALSSYQDPYLKTDLLTAGCLRSLDIDGDRVSASLRLNYAAGRIVGGIGQMLTVALENVPGVESARVQVRSEEHTSELQSRPHLVCRLLLEKKKNK